MSIGIILADDHKLFREGIRTLFERHYDLRILGEADSGHAATKLARKLHPDVVIIDITMPDLNGIGATRRILAQNPEIKVVALSMHSERRFILEMFRAGATAYLLKDCAFEELIQAIYAVTENRSYLSPGVRTVVLEECLLLAPDKEALAPPLLSPREREVLQLFAEGKTTTLVAKFLNLSPKTVETHRSKIMKKLNIHTLAELTRYAIREDPAAFKPDHAAFTESKLKPYLPQADINRSPRRARSLPGLSNNPAICN